MSTCAGVISRDAFTEEFIERGACEVHLFEPGTCEWQQKVYDERETRRQAERASR